MVYAAGGEVAFVARMIDDSQTVGDSILCVCQGTITSQLMVLP